MVKIYKRRASNHNEVVKALVNNINVKKECYYRKESGYLYLSPDRTLFDSSTESEINMEGLMSAYLDALSGEYVIACYTSSNGSFKVVIGKVFRDAISAVKHAKKSLKEEVIDVSTGRVFKTNG